MSDYPRVLYHMAVERPVDRFGKVTGGHLHYVGDLVSPNYPISNTVANAQGLRGRQMGQGSEHLIAHHHYKTMMLALYFPDGVTIDEEACHAEEERLLRQGWVRHPDQLKEEYDEA